MYPSVPGTSVVCAVSVPAGAVTYLIFKVRSYRPAPLKSCVAQIRLSSTACCDIPGCHPSSVIQHDRSVPEVTVAADGADVSGMAATQEYRVMPSALVATGIVGMSVSSTRGVDRDGPGRLCFVLG